MAAKVVDLLQKIHIDGDEPDERNGFLLHRLLQFLELFLGGEAVSDSGQDITVGHLLKGLCLDGLPEAAADLVDVAGIDGNHHDAEGVADVCCLIRDCPSLLKVGDHVEERGHKAKGQDSKNQRRIDSGSPVFLRHHLPDA